MLSPNAQSQWYEIWIYAHPDHREPVQECGMFQSELEAVRMGARLSLWLHEDILTEPLFEMCASLEDRMAIIFLADSLRKMGIDPKRVMVTARPLASHDNAESAVRANWRNIDPDDDDGDDADDSTPVLVPDGGEMVVS